MPYDELPGFMMALRKHRSSGAPALEFLILTAGRRGEVVGMRWEEVNFDRATWTIPASRMKGAREHVVPLAKRAIEILRQQSQNDVPFPVTGQTMTWALKELGRTETVHGFRSTFRDWVAERTNYPNHVAEMALPHAVPSAVEAAYRRGNLLEKRARLMEEWAQFCGTPISPAIISFRRIS